MNSRLTADVGLEDGDVDVAVEVEGRDEEMGDAAELAEVTDDGKRVERVDQRQGVTDGDIGNNRRRLCS